MPNKLMLPDENHLDQENAGTAMFIRLMATSA